MSESISAMLHDRDPKEYYYKRFRAQFAEFVKISNAHEHTGEGTYISIQELNPNNLSHIPKEDRQFFHCALACTILIDQVMYTHFKDDYPQFQQMTQYPKIEYSITNINVHPWSITHNATESVVLKDFLKFFVDDLREFFGKNYFKEATWEAVKSAMLEDEDVTKGAHGKLLEQVLKEEESKA